MASGLARVRGERKLRRRNGSRLCRTTWNVDLLRAAFHMDTERWIIGPDPDRTLFLQLSLALRRLNFKMNSDWDRAIWRTFP